MRRSPGSSTVRFRPLAVLVGVACSLVVFGVVTALMGIAYGLIASLSYPRWAYLAVHIPALLVGGVWAGRSARSLGWLHGLLVGLGYAAAAFWLMPHSGSLQLADLFRALTLSLPVALLGGVLGRNLVSAT
ncbi:MAG: TIGR04086 family membrane protein [Firmicutes bacterium]|uniref:TIGR04086 family membrane protein n=1 Tax=Limnochorda pilosa TaxID=1555112 RepID=UPI001799D1EC|nr:TIGR04086 family membrane protein [Limnochorda pilosa]NMA71398.1 TIGR04086 family membrane protein [Bacillota bacterium]